MPQLLMELRQFHHHTHLTPYHTTKTTPHHNNLIRLSYPDWIFRRLMELKRGVGYGRWNDIL
ncbi:hypothetical protein Droror1_Dr00016218, partial [Drosera rotundifolia]